MQWIVRVACVVLLLAAPIARASDFEEAQQEIPESRFHASMQERRTGPATDPASQARHRALFAHADCVRAAKVAEEDVAKTCAVTRAAYRTHLPQEFSALEVLLLEQRLTAAPMTAR